MFDKTGVRNKRIVNYLEKEFVITEFVINRDYCTFITNGEFNPHF